MFTATFIQRDTVSNAVIERTIQKPATRIRATADSEVKPRFETEEDRKEFNQKRMRARHAQFFNANFSPSSLYSTLTFSNAWEVHTFDDARRIRNNFIRRIKRAAPDAVIFLYMGRGKGTHRIHFHMVTEGVSQELIEKHWLYGSIVRIENLRENNYYDGKNYGQDYTGLANYLFDHWTEEQGGKHYYKSMNARKPHREEPVEVTFRYTERRTPRAPKGYVLVESKATKYGFLYFKYVKKPTERRHRQEQKNKPK